MTDELGKALRQDALMRGALVALLDRAGGSATYTETEYQAIAARYGGTESLGVSIEVDSTAAGPVVRLSLVRKTPAPRGLVV